MDVFATKDGRIYRVSLKNFIAATNKKAPYYKRVKKKNEVVEKAYAVCPGCGNPVHFVNLFNTKKKKKPHARHQRSSIKGLAKYRAAAYKNCPYVNKSADAFQNIAETNDSLGSFCNAMVEAFGFSRSSAETMARIYLYLIDDDQETADQCFFAMMASAWYNNVSLYDAVSQPDESKAKKLAVGVLWNAIGGIKSEEAMIGLVCSFGIERSEAEGLFCEIRDQHSEPAYDSYSDFAHLCATAATILNDNATAKAIGGSFSFSSSGIDSADASSGYIGDLCGTDGVEPSMNNGDYKADLDAVNLTQQVRSSANKSLLAIVSSYYADIEAGRINRALEFKENIGMKALRDQRDAFYLAEKKKIYGYSEKEDLFSIKESREKNELLNEKVALFDTFVECIDRGAEDWPDE